MVEEDDFIFSNRLKIQHKVEKGRKFQSNFLYARLVGTYYGMAFASVCPSVRPSVCMSICHTCKHDTDWTVPARVVKLGTHTTYDKRMNPIDFQGKRSKVKVKRYTMLLNLVNVIQTEQFQLGPSNLEHILLITRGWDLLIFKVKVTRYTLLLNLVNMIQTEPFQLGLSNLKHILLMIRGQYLLIFNMFKVRGQRSKPHATHYC